MPLTREDLDDLAIGGCQEPGCDHAHDQGVRYLHGHCHVGVGVEVSYTFGSGQLVISCRRCHAPVGEVLVGAAGLSEAPRE